jgi:hypothetical protein
VAVVLSQVKLKPRLQREIPRLLDIFHFAIQTTLSMWAKAGTVEVDTNERRGRKTKLNARGQQVIIRQSKKVEELFSTPDINMNYEQCTPFYLWYRAAASFEYELAILSEHIV